MFYFSTILSSQQHATPPVEERTGSGPAWFAFNLTIIKRQKQQKQLAESGSE